MLLNTHQTSTEAYLVNDLEGLQELLQSFIRFELWLNATKQEVKRK